jgi:hypothetical protein
MCRIDGTYGVPVTDCDALLLVPQQQDHPIVLAHGRSAANAGLGAASGAAKAATSGKAPAASQAPARQRAASPRR